MGCRRQHRARRLEHSEIIYEKIAPDDCFTAKGIITTAEKAWNAALAITLGFEGGAVDHPDDLGGATNLGITQATLDRARNLADAPELPDNVVALKIEQAVEIYRLLFWDQSGFAAIAAAGHFATAICGFDFAVNSGAKKAAHVLQEGLNLANRGGRDWPNLTADGVIGQQTIAALAACAAKRGERETASFYLDMRVWRIIDITRARVAEKNETFVWGWIGRIGKMRQFVEHGKIGKPL